MNAETGEESQFDDLGEPPINRGQLDQRLIERQKIDDVGPLCLERFWKCHGRLATAALSRVPTARMVHEDLPHETRRNRKEMRPILR